jgi:TRAP-type C4-dicarboxylate transport system permease small subunit
LGKVLGACENGGRYLGIAATVAIMAIIACDVIFRYAFNAPLAWAYEFIGLYVMAALFFLPLGYVQRCHGNIAVDLFVKLLPVPARSAFSRLGNVLAACVFAIACGAFAVKALDAFVSGDEIIGPYIWVTWPIYTIVAVGLGLFVLRLLVQVYQSDATLQHDAAEGDHSV